MTRIPYKKSGILPVLRLPRINYGASIKKTPEMIKTELDFEAEAEIDKRIKEEESEFNIKKPNVYKFLKNTVPAPRKNSKNKGYGRVIIEDLKKNTQKNIPKNKLKNTSKSGEKDVVGSWKSEIARYRRRALRKALLSIDKEVHNKMLKEEKRKLEQESTKITPEFESVINKLMESKTGLLDYYVAPPSLEDLKRKNILRAARRAEVNKFEAKERSKSLITLYNSSMKYISDEKSLDDYVNAVFSTTTKEVQTYLKSLTLQPKRTLEAEKHEIQAAISYPAYSSIANLLTDSDTDGNPTLKSLI